MCGELYETLSYFPRSDRPDIFPCENADGDYGTIGTHFCEERRPVEADDGSFTDYDVSRTDPVDRDAVRPKSIRNWRILVSP